MALVTEGQIIIKAIGLTRTQWDALKGQIDSFLAAHPQLSLDTRMWQETEA